MSERLSVPALLTLTMLAAGCSETELPAALPRSYPGDFSLETERQKAMAKARATVKEELVTKTPFTCMPPWSEESCDEELSRKTVSPDETVGVKKEEGCGALWLSTCTTEIVDTEKLVEACSEDQAAVLKRIREKASTALSNDTVLETVWKAKEGGNPYLNDVPWTALSSATSPSEDRADICPKDPAFLLENSGQNKIYGFTVDAERAAFTPLMFESAEQSPLCDRAAVLAKIEYCRITGECDYTTQTALPGASQVTPNELRALVAGFCVNPEKTVNGEKESLSAYYGFTGPYEIKPDGLHTKGTAPIKGRPVTGEFIVKSDKSTCVDANKPVEIDLGGGKKLQVEFSGCQTPNDAKDATLIEGSSSTTLTAFAAAGASYDWSTCGADTDGNCDPYYRYTLDQDTFAWTGPVETAR